MRLDLVRSLAHDVRDALPARFDGEKLAKYKDAFAGVRLDEGLVELAVNKYDALCDRYRARHAYLGPEELVNETKVAPMQAVAILWVAPFRYDGRHPKGPTIAVHANYQHAEFVIQEFLELDPAKYTTKLRRRVSACLGAIVEGEAARFAETDGLGVAIDDRPVEHAIDLMVAICEFLVDGCRSAIPHDQFVRAAHGRESGEGPLAKPHRG